MASISLFMFTIALILATCSAAPATDFGLEIPESCKGQLYCPIEPKGYKLLQDKMNSALPSILVQEYDDREGGDDEIRAPEKSPKSDWHNCPYVSKRESMYMYNHLRNNSKTEIIVQTNLFRQYVDVVTCSTEDITVPKGGQQCFQQMLTGSESIMQSTCETITARRTLYVYDVEKNVIIQKALEVPACCVCKIEYKDEE